MKKQIVLFSLCATVSLIGVEDKNVVEKLKAITSPTVQLTLLFSSPLLTSGADIANDPVRNQIVTTGDAQMNPMDYGLQIYDDQGKSKGTLMGHTDIATCFTKLPSDQDHLVSSGADGQIIIWNLKTNKADKKIIGKWQNLCLLALDDNTVVAGGGADDYDGSRNALFIWNLQNQQSFPCVGHKQIPCVKLIASQLGTWFASNASNNVSGLNLQQYQKLMKLKMTDKYQEVFSKETVPLQDIKGETRIWDSKGNPVSDSLPGGGALALWEWNNSGYQRELLVTGNEIINFLDPKSNFTTKLTINDRQIWVNVVKFSGWHLVSGGQDGRAIIYKILYSGNASDVLQVVKVATCNGHQSPIVDLKILDKQNLVATLSNGFSPNWDGSLRIWDLNGNQLAKIFDAQLSTVIRELNPDQTLFAIGSRNNVYLVQMQVNGQKDSNKEEINALELTANANNAAISNGCEKSCKQCDAINDFHNLLSFTLALFKAATDLANEQK